MTKIITKVYISVSYPKCKFYQYVNLPTHAYKLLCSALAAAMYDGSIVDYLIFNREVPNYDEERH